MAAGDSITAGVGTSNPSTQAWPAILQSRLGGNFTVYNEGLSGSTAITDSALPYYGSSQYSAGLALNPNAVVIELGTNDSSTTNFNLATTNSDFVNSLTTIVNAYKATANHPAIWLVLPPTIYTAAPSDNETNLAVLMPLIQQVATATGAGVIDNNTMTQSESTLYANGLHPNIQGAAMLGQNIFASLDATYVNNGPLGTGTITLSGGTLSDDGNARTLSNSLAITGNVTFASTGSGSLTFDPTGLATPSTVTISNSPTLTVNNTTTIKEAVSGTGFTLAGSGVLVLSGANNYSGGTTIQSGTLRAGATNTLPTGGTLTFGGNGGAAGTLDLNGYGLTVAGLAVAPGANAASQIITNSNTSSAGATATLTFNGGTSSFGGTLQDGGNGNLLALTVSGGALTLSGMNNYSGATTISGGTLLVANAASTSATGNSAVTIASGATLAGAGITNTGFIGGGVTVSSGGFISPSGGSGVSPGSANVGTLTVGALTLNGGSALNYQVSDTQSFDSIVVAYTGTPTGTGVLTLPTSGAATFNFYQAGSITPYVLGNGVYQLMMFGSVVGGGTNISSLSVNSADLPLGDVGTFSTSGGNVLDLTIASGNASASWAHDGDGSFGIPSNWSGNTIPGGVGLTATFGNSGLTSSIINVSVGSETVGSLIFNNNSSTTYSLGSGTLTLNNSGNSGGASVNVGSGGVNSYLQSSLALTLADSSLSTTFNIGSGSYLDVTGPINQSTGAQQIVLAGGGTLVLDNGTNSYSGGTTVSSGTLNVTAVVAGTSTLGTGPLAINGSSSVVNLSAPAITTGSLSGTDGGTLNVGSTTTLTVNQTTTSTFNGTLTLNGGLVLANASGNTLTISGTPTLGSSSSITVNSGTLALTNNTNSSANVSGTPTVSVAPSATLQLAGSSNVLSSAVNITMHGSGIASDGALTVDGASTQTVGVISGTAGSGSVTTYAGNTTVGDGSNAANLTATQILQNTLTINAGSTVTIAPSGSGIPADAVAATTAVASSQLASSAATAGNDSGTDPFTAIQAAIASGSISSAKGQQLENRIAAIERLAATDPGLDVSLLEDRVLAALPSASVWSSSDASPLVETGSGLLAVDSSMIGSSSSLALGGATAFAPATDFAGGPAAVPEPSTLLLAAVGSIAVLIAVRRRSRIEQRTT